VSSVVVDLLSLLHDAARGAFPPGDFSTTHFPSPSSPADAVLAFFGHHVIASDVSPEFVTQWTDRDPFALSDVRFLSALASELTTTPGILDAVFAAIGEGLAPGAVGLTETADRSHPRVLRALAYRDPSTIRVFRDDSGHGMLMIGSGLAGRIEAAYEVEPEGRRQGLGRKLIVAARQLGPANEPVFLQISPGNVWSMKTLKADPVWNPIGAEMLFLRESNSDQVS
jgi:GNAT superfamily N-acetyltransferase